MHIIVAILFLLPPVSVTLYLYVFGVFTNRRAFQFSVYALLALYALTIGISTHYSSQGYDVPATTSEALTEVPPES